MKESIWAVLPTGVADRAAVDAAVEPHMRAVPLPEPVVETFSRSALDRLRVAAEDRAGQKLPHTEYTDVEILALHYGSDDFEAERVFTEGERGRGLQVTRRYEFHRDNPWTGVSTDPAATLIDHHGVFPLGDFLSLLPEEIARAEKIAAMEYDRMTAATEGIEPGLRLADFLGDKYPSGLAAFREYAKEPWPRAAAASRGVVPTPGVMPECEYERYFIGSGGRERFITHAACRVLNPTALILADGTLLRKETFGVVPEWSQAILDSLGTQDPGHVLVALVGHAA